FTEHCGRSARLWTPCSIISKANARRANMQPSTEPLEYESPDVAEDAASCLEFDVLSPPVDQVADFPGKMKWFARLAHDKRESDDPLDQIKAGMAELEPDLLDEMALHGVDRQTVLGLTIFPQMDLIVSKKADKDGVTTEALVEALKLCGLAYMVSEG